METWRDMCQQNLLAARELLGRRLWRNVVSRAYYSAYCAVTGELLMTSPGVRFPHRFGNPPHARLPAYLERNFDARKYSVRRRGDLAKTLATLREARTDADYRPTAKIGEREAMEALQRARFIIRRIGWEV